MTNRKQKYTKELLEKLIIESTSMSEVVRKIGKRTDRGFVTYLTKLSKKFGIDISHFKNRSQQARERNCDQLPLEDYLSNKREIGSDRLRRRLFDRKIKEKKCEECGITDWNGKYLGFNLHHIDSNHYNNNLDNLMIVCPNCHYCLHDHERNIKREEKRMKKIKNKILVKGNKRCSNLHPNKRKVNRPSYSILLKEIGETNFCVVAKKHGVTDNTIRKWIKMYEKYDILD